MTLRRPGQRPEAPHGADERGTPRTGAPRSGGHPAASRAGAHRPPGGHAPEARGARRAAAGGRLPRTGTEPVTARSALRARLVLASIFTPVFIAATARFAYWTAETGTGEAPITGSMLVLTVACGLLALFSVVDLLVVLRRRREEREAPPGRNGPGAGVPGRGTGPRST